jgi:hypothetical protein
MGFPEGCFATGDLHELGSPPLNFHLLDTPVAEVVGCMMASVWFFRIPRPESQRAASALGLDEKRKVSLKPGYRSIRRHTSDRVEVSKPSRSLGRAVSANPEPGKSV